MDCHQLEPLIEAIADGTWTPEPEQAAHLASCTVCAARLSRAQAIEQLLVMREVAAPPASFTAQVMAHVGRERWQAERAIDLGFNLAMAAGVLVILAGAAGLAWSLGMLTITIDVDQIWQALDADVTGRFLTQVQTIGMAAVILTMALVLWWWAEAASD